MNMTTDRQMRRQRLIVLTGVGSPGQVGEAVAAAFAAAGDHTVLVDRDLAAVRDRAASIQDTGGTASAYAADLSDREAAGRLAATIEGDHGAAVDAVVHMAGGWASGGNVALAQPAHWERMLSINLMTAVLTTQAFMPLVRAARGCFVYFASEAAIPGARVSGMAAYAVAKQGVATVMRAVAEEERSHGVRANAVAPSAIRTASNEQAMGATAPYVERSEVAATVLWLCSPAATAVSGQLIHLASARRSAGDG